jgi:hypothetical protein
MPSDSGIIRKAVVARRAPQAKLGMIFDVNFHPFYFKEEP